MGECINRTVEILLVEDNSGDVRLMAEALKKCPVPHRLNSAQDVAEALAAVRQEGAFSGRPCPDLIILDLKLPKQDGTEFLKTVKGDPRLKVIPVVVMSSSKSEQDIVKCYNLHANCYITKPILFHDLEQVMQSLMRFWFETVILPKP